MKVYVIVGVYQGVIDNVEAAIDKDTAMTRKTAMLNKYDIKSEEELANSESDIQIFEVEVHQQQ